MIEWTERWFRTLLGLVRSVRPPRDIEDEIASHLALDVEAQAAAGVSRETAMRNARLRLGGATQSIERCRDESRLPWIGDFTRDIRLASRQLVANPGFGLAAVVTLALGIGAAAAIFSVASGVLWAPLPYPNADRRVMLFSRWISFNKTSVADQEIVDYRSQAQSLRSVAGWGTEHQNLTGGGPPARVAVGLVTANTFEVLGVSPLLGRSFTEAEDQPRAAPVAMLSASLWRTRFGADPNVVGKSIVIDDVAATVIGVMPDRFRLPSDYTMDVTDPTQLWRPLQLDEHQLSRSHSYFAAATLAPGYTAASATAELRTITRRLTEQGAYRASMEFTAFAVTLDDEIRGGLRPVVMLLTGGVLCLLGIACANVSSLLLVRGEARHHEFVLRSALGASPGRQRRQLMVEGFLLAAVGACAGLPVAMLGLRVLVSLAPAALPALAPLQLDWPMTLVAFAIAAIVTIAFSVVPTMSRVSLGLAGVLRQATNSSASRSRARVRQSLVFGQVAVATVLLIAAGLMVRSLAAIGRVELGFDPQHVLTMRVVLPESRYASPEQVVDFYRLAIERVRALPGTRAAGIVRLLPLATSIGDYGLDVEGFDESKGQNAKGDWQIVSDGAFEAMGARLIRGRWFTAADRTSSQPVAVVNETLARTYWRDSKDVIGGRLRVGSAADRPWAVVVGVVADERHNGVTSGVKEKFYIPHSQWHVVRPSAPVRDAFFVVRTDGDPLTLSLPLQRVIQDLDGQLPVSVPQTMTSVVVRSVATPRLAGFLLGTFAIVATALAGIGVYGVLAYVVSRRTREIGIRMALGSRRDAVLAHIVGQGLGLCGAGVVAGAAAAFVLTRGLQGLLYNVTPLDPLTFLAVPGLLLLVTIMASAIPGLRAASMSPSIALRAD